MCVRVVGMVVVLGVRGRRRITQAWLRREAGEELQDINSKPSRCPWKLHTNNIDIFIFFLAKAVVHMYVRRSFRSSILGFVSAFRMRGLQHWNVSFFHCLSHWLPVHHTVHTRQHTPSPDAPSLCLDSPDRWTRLGCSATHARTRLFPVRSAAPPLKGLVHSVPVHWSHTLRRDCLLSSLMSFIIVASCGRDCCGRSVRKRGRPSRSLSRSLFNPA